MKCFCDRRSSIPCTAQPELSGAGSEWPPTRGRRHRQVRAQLLAGAKRHPASACNHRASPTPLSRVAFPTPLLLPKRAPTLWRAEPAPSSPAGRTFSSYHSSPGSKTRGMSGPPPLEPADASAAPVLPNTLPSARHFLSFSKLHISFSHPPAQHYPRERQDMSHGIMPRLHSGCFLTTPPSGDPPGGTESSKSPTTALANATTFHAP